MHKDVTEEMFLESLRVSAKGNHGKNSITGKKRLVENNYGQPYRMPTQVPYRPPTQIPQRPPTELPSDDIELGPMIDPDEDPDDIELGPMIGGPEDASGELGVGPPIGRGLSQNPLTSRMPMKGLLSKMRGQDSTAPSANAGPNPKVAHAKQELEAVHQQLSALLNRLNGVLKQL